MRKVTRLAMFAAALPAALSACSGEKNAAPPAERPEVTVHTVDVANRKVPAAEAYVGNIRSNEIVVIATKMMGRILALPVHEGDAVHTGQALVTIDVAEAQSAFDQSRASVTSANVGLANAQKEYDRVTTLFQHESVSKQTVEQVEGQLAAARAHRDQAAASQRASGTALSYGALTSPINGVVTHRWMDPGSLAGPGAPILTVENPALLDLSVQVPETRARSLAIGQSAEVSVPALDRTFSAEILAIVPSADPMTRTNQVKLKLPAGGGVMPGLFASVRFDAMSFEAVAIPKDALVTEGQMDGVYVVQGDRARLRWIQAGHRSGDIVQVLAGLHAGERIVSPLPANIADDVRVKVLP
jgi:RND family efflux transporter MFP subunit